MDISAKYCHMQTQWIRFYMHFSQEKSNIMPGINSLFLSLNVAHAVSYTVVMLRSSTFGHSNKCNTMPGWGQ